MATTAWQCEFTVPPDDRDGVCGVKFEDGGHAAIMYHAVDNDSDDPFFIRFHSWEENEPCQHTLFRSLMGKRVRVTIEVLD